MPMVLQDKIAYRASPNMSIHLYVPPSLAAPAAPAAPAAAAPDNRVGGQRTAAEQAEQQAGRLPRANKKGCKVFRRRESTTPLLKAQHDHSRDAAVPWASRTP
ncbi:hypothetical protein ONE63_008359 [Megalurothrips usitatus]|uniref:Uncharacterized protein n=1 Tax=Megalurothrips usitatus TaxID=439358 RepID=A0AAV7XP90_9NEOP|nr:hypothetical protein ONE63_008359 [Megalurothrips usitatus]